MKKAILFIFIILITVACSSNDEAENNGWDRSALIPTVETIQTVSGSLPLEERLTGVVRARNQIEIYSEINGQVAEIFVNSGERVQAGAPLLRLRDTELRERVRQAELSLEIVEAQVRQAEVNLNTAKSRLARAEQLRSRELETEAEIENLKADVETLEANLQLVQAQRNQAASVLDERNFEFDNSVVRAPINGFIGLRTVEVGQNINTGTRLFEIGDLSEMTIQVSLNEGMLSYIEEGQTVNITSRAFGDNFVEAQLTRISPFLNPVTNATEAEIVVPNDAGLLRSGMFVTIDILYGESSQAVLVPNTAIYRNPNDGRRGVFIAEASSINELEFVDEERPEIIGPVPMRFVPVEIVAQGRQVSGIDGINSGDYVVTIGQNLLASGRESARLRVIEWDRVIRLQELQSRDLLEMIQQKLANRNGVDTSGV